jgi:trans-2,3-dihydro-3-hydroxyanthranilate isomerase
VAQSLALNLPMGRIHVDFEVDPDEGERAWFVAPPAVLGPTCPPDTLADAVGIAAADVDALRGPAQQVSAGVSALIVPVHDLQALRRCTVGADALTRLAGLGWPSLIYFFCFQTHRPENDVCARFFFDAHGVREDPATGNGASFLGAYLLEHGPLTKACLRIEQGHHVGRPSLVLLRTDRVAGGHEVKVGGSAAFVSREEAARVERMLSSPSMARLGLQPGPQDLRSRSASVRPEEFLRYSMTIRGK